MNKLAWFYPVGHQLHREAGHPEKPERIESIRRAMELLGWWDTHDHVNPIPLARDLLESVHSRNYLNRLEVACARGDPLDMDTYTTSASWALALNTAGGAAALADLVWKTSFDPQANSIMRGFALTRPPGHHAERDQGMGFCLINNIAIAAENLLTQPMSEIRNLTRLAIVDLDLHHGNGTQNIFWERGDVLFISTHQAPLYPGTGAMNEIGRGAGEGCTVNLPMPPGTGDNGYQAAMAEIILPLVDRFQPEIILVSVGFDAHWRDPLGHLLLTADGYGKRISELTAWVDSNAGGRIALFLEGGYDTSAMSACATASVAALIGESFDDPLGPSPRPEGNSWQTVINKAKEIWQL